MNRPARPSPSASGRPSRASNVSGGEGGDPAGEKTAFAAKRGSKCSMCGSTNVKREQKKHNIIQVTCKDCGYKYKYPGTLQED